MYILFSFFLSVSFSTWIVTISNEKERQKPCYLQQNCTHGCYRVRFKNTSKLLQMRIKTITATTWNLNDNCVPSSVYETNNLLYGQFQLDHHYIKTFNLCESVFRITIITNAFNLKKKKTRNRTSVFLFHFQLKKSKNIHSFIHFLCVLHLMRMWATKARNLKFNCHHLY